MVEYIPNKPYHKIVFVCLYRWCVFATSHNALKENKDENIHRKRGRD